jgi:PAS domain S-box-containing protein
MMDKQFESCEELHSFAIRMKAVIDASHNLMILKDQNFKYRIVNKTFCDFTGRSEENIIGKTDFDIFPKEKAEKYRKSDIHVVESKKTLVHEILAATDVWVEEIKIPLFYENGSLMGIFVSLRDINRRKQLEEEIRKSEERLSAVYNNMSVGISIVDKSGRYLQANETWLRMTGYSENEIMQKTISDITHPEDLGKSIDFINKTGEGKLNSYHIEKRYVRKDSSIFWGDLSVTPLKDKNGNIEAIVGVISDITKRKEAEKLKEDIDRMTRHDLKNPLNGVIGFPAVIMKDENINERQRKILKMIEFSGYQMLKMINLSLDMYKMEKGTYNFSPKEVNLLSVINNIMDEFETLMSSRNVKIETYIDGEILQENQYFIVKSEELLCYSMLANIFKNAIEASPENGIVSLRLQRGQGVAKISVHNKGAVPEKIRGTFFEKYVTMGKKDGTGLGAYSAKLIAETHGGEISMDTSEEKGTEVAITLPD